MQKITSVLLGLLVFTQIPQAMKAHEFNRCVNNSLKPIQRARANNTSYYGTIRDRQDAVRYCNAG